MLPLVKGEILFDDYSKSFTGATVYIRVEDVSRLDAPSKPILEQVIRNVSYNGNDIRTVNFELHGTMPDIKASYAIRVHVDIDNNREINLGDLVNVESYPIITHSNSNPNILSVRVKEIK